MNLSCLASAIARRPYLPLWLLAVVTGLLLRPLTPLDETRVASVAWEMWQRQDFLVPYLNGHPYSHKPPLLQWCIHLSWLLFGVNDWTPRLIAPLFALGNLWLTERLAARLWPRRIVVARLAPLLLLGIPLWGFWATLTLYDLLMGFFVLAVWHGVLEAAQGRLLRGWGYAGLAIGGAVLAKGPVILVFLLPPALLAPWWMEAKPAAGWGRFYGGLLGAILLGAAIGYAWAIPAALAGGESYGKKILWGQFAGRVTKSFAHNRPWWWYGPMLPLLLLPWVAWPSLWRSAARLAWDSGLRFCLAVAAPVLLIFSLISGKQVHYLLPLFPLLALAAARALANPSVNVCSRPYWGLGLLLIAGGLCYEWLQCSQALIGVPNKDNSPLPSLLAPLPWWWKLAMLAGGTLLLWWRRPLSAAPAAAGLAVLLAGPVFLLGHIAYYYTSYSAWDVSPMARRISELQKAGVPLVHEGVYHGDFQFIGRLEQPLKTTRGPAAIQHWIATHPDGYIVGRFVPGKALLPPEKAEVVDDYRGRKLALWKAANLADAPIGR
jgi:4-amino-4-deoxy-L-arabinose transferase-like glycosyltransferase